MKANLREKVQNVSLNFWHSVIFDISKFSNQKLFKEAKIFASNNGYITNENKRPLRFDGFEIEVCYLFLRKFNSCKPRKIKGIV